jgi:hypothetical protein
VFPFGSIGGYYETNLGLNPINSQELQVSGLAAEAGVALRSATPKSTFMLKPYLRSTYFPSETESDFNNAFADLNYNYTGLRSTAALITEYSRETVSSAALPGTEVRGDLGNPRDGDVSLATTRSKRDLLSLYPMASWALTQRNTLQLTGSYVDVAYDLKLPGEELGYKFARGGVGWAYNMTQLSMLSLTASTQKFDPEDAPGLQPSVGSTSNALTARWTRTLDAKRRFYIEGGATRTKFERAAASAVAGSTETGYNGGVGASWQFETSSLFADLVHSVQPSSSGAVSNQSDARVQLIRSINQRLQATIGARAIQSKAVNPNAATDDRQYAIASLGLEWRWKPQWSVVGTYDFIHQKLENQTGADTHRVLLSLAYDAGRR